MHGPSSSLNLGSAYAKVMCPESPDVRVLPAPATCPLSLRQTVVSTQLNMQAGGAPTRQQRAISETRQRSAGY